MGVPAFLRDGGPGKKACRGAEKRKANHGGSQHEGRIMLRSTIKTGLKPALTGLRVRKQDKVDHCYLGRGMIYFL